MQTLWLIIKGIGLLFTVRISTVIGLTLGRPRKFKASNEFLLPDWFFLPLGAAVVALWALRIINGWGALGIAVAAGFLSNYVGEKLCWTRMTPEKITQYLVRQLPVNSKASRNEIASLLGHCGPDAVLPLISALETDEDSRFRLAAAQALANIGDARAVPAILRALFGEKNEDYCEVLAKALITFKAQALQPLLASLASANRDDRLRAAQWLGRLGLPQAIPGLAAKLDDHWLVARKAAKSLQALEWTPPDIPDRIRMALALDDDKALANIGPCAADVLIDVLRDETRGVVPSAAVSALGAFGDAHAVSVLVRLTENGAHFSKTVCQDAAIALGRIGGPEAMAALQKLFVKNRDNDIRAAAAGGLAEMGAMAFGPVRSVATHPAPGLRLIVMDALARHGGEWSQEILISGLADPVYAVRKAATSGLRKLGFDAGTGATLDVKPKPDECAFCGARLENIPITFFMDEAIGRATATQDAQAAGALMRAACSCTCGLPVCYTCFKFGKNQCPDCGRKVEMTL